MSQPKTKLIIPEQQRDNCAHVLLLLIKLTGVSRNLLCYNFF